MGLGLALLVPALGYFKCYVTAQSEGKRPNSGWRLELNVARENQQNADFSFVHNDKYIQAVGYTGNVSFCVSGGYMFNAVSLCCHYGAEIAIRTSETSSTVRCEVFLMLISWGPIV